MLVNSQLIGNTGYETMAVGTTAQRPTNPNDGYIRFNTTTGYAEVYNATVGQWLQFGSSPLISVEYLVVAGGGGGSGKSGGSGIVIIRYTNSAADAVTTGSPSYSNSGGYKWYTFTGSGTISWS